MYIADIWYHTNSKENIWFIYIYNKDKDKLCKVEQIKVNETQVDEGTDRLRERYAKTARLRFYPRQELDDLFQVVATEDFLPAN